MKAAKTVAFALVIGMTCIVASARPFDGKQKDDPVKRAEKEAMARYEAARRAAPLWPQGAVPRSPGRPLALVGPRGDAGHRCPIVVQQVWVVGRYEQVVEYRQVYERGGWRGGARFGGACRTVPVVVRHWVPGHYETVTAPDGNCACHGQASIGAPGPHVPGVRRGW